MLSDESSDHRTYTRIFKNEHGDVVIHQATIEDETQDGKYTVSAVFVGPPDLGRLIEKLKEYFSEAKKYECTGHLLGVSTKTEHKRGEIRTGHDGELRG